MDFEVLIRSGIFEEILVFLDLQSLAICERICRMWQGAVTGRVWRRAAHQLFKTKKYIPRPSQLLLEAMVVGGDQVDEEKGEEEAEEERKKKEKEIIIFSLLRVGEPSPKAAIRIALADCLRREIQFDELISFVWCHRLRFRGHGLQQLVPQDSWHQGKPVGTRVRFHRNGIFEYLCEPGAPLAFLQHHIAELDQGATFSLHRHSIRLDPFNVWGEILRHPSNWGWILLLPASIWTSYEMPLKGQDAFLDMF